MELQNIASSLRMQQISGASLSRDDQGNIVLPTSLARTLIALHRHSRIDQDQVQLLQHLSQCAFEEFSGLVEKKDLAESRVDVTLPNRAERAGTVLEHLARNPNVEHSRCFVQIPNHVSLSDIAEDTCAVFGSFSLGISSISKDLMLRPLLHARFIRIHGNIEMMVASSEGLTMSSVLDSRMHIEELEIVDHGIVDPFRIVMLCKSLKFLKTLNISNLSMGWAGPCRPDKHIGLQPGFIQLLFIMLPALQSINGHDRAAADLSNYCYRDGAKAVTPAAAEASEINGLEPMGIEFNIPDPNELYCAISMPWRQLALHFQAGREIGNSKSNMMLPIINRHSRRMENKEGTKPFQNLVKVGRLLQRKRFGLRKLESLDHVYARQLDAHPCISGLLAVGCRTGEVHALRTVAEADHFHEMQSGRSSQQQPQISHSESGPLRPFCVDSSCVLGVSWLRSRSYAKCLIGTSEGTICLLDCQDTALFAEGATSLPLSKEKQYTAVDELTCVVTNSECNAFAASGHSNSIWIYDLTTGKRDVIDSVHSDSINVVDFSYTNPYLLATSSMDKYVHLLDLRMDGRRVASTWDVARPTILTRFKQDDTSIVVSGVNNDAQVLDVRMAGKPVMMQLLPSTDEGNYTRTYFGNSGQALYMGTCMSDVLRVFDPTTGCCLAAESISTTNFQRSFGFIQSLRPCPIYDWKAYVLFTAGRSTQVLDVNLAPN